MAYGKMLNVQFKISGWIQFGKWVLMFIEAIFYSYENKF